MPHTLNEHPSEVDQHEETNDTDPLQEPPMNSCNLTICAVSNEINLQYIDNSTEPSSMNIELTENNSMPTGLSTIDTNAIEVTLVSLSPTLDELK